MEHFVLYWQLWNMNKFGERLKELRIECDKSRKTLAKELNVLERTISFWELGQRECDFDMLIKICRLFNVSADYILGLED